MLNGRSCLQMRQWPKEIELKEQFEAMVGFSPEEVFGPPAGFEHFGMPMEGLGAMWTPEGEFIGPEEFAPPKGFEDPYMEGPEFEPPEDIYEPPPDDGQYH